MRGPFSKNHQRIYDEAILNTYFLMDEAKIWLDQEYGEGFSAQNPALVIDLVKTYSLNATVSKDLDHEGQRI
jgi:hypothetical protein